jgi:hypothetical protein
MLPANCADGQAEYPSVMRLGIGRVNYKSALTHIFAEFDKAWNERDLDKEHRSIRNKIKQTLRRKFWGMVSRPDLINYIFMNICLEFEKLLKIHLPHGESIAEYMQEFNLESLMVQKGNHIPQWFQGAAAPASARKQVISTEPISTESTALARKQVISTEPTSIESTA